MNVEIRVLGGRYFSNYYCSKLLSRFSSSSY
jgi:hypothetical protein